MNCYTFDEIQIGHKESFVVTLSDGDIEAFRKITGDNNPLHCDDKYARERGYNGRVVYGMLTASYLSTLAGVYLPGEKCLIHEVTTKFDAPITEVGNIRVCGEVVKKHDLFRLLTLNVEIRSGENVLLLHGTMKVSVASE